MLDAIARLISGRHIHSSFSKQLGVLFGQTKHGRGWSFFPSLTVVWMCSSITLHQSKWMCPSITLHLSKWMCSSITLHLSKYLMFINSTSLLAIHRSKLQIKVFVNNTTVLSRHELTVSDFEILMKSCSIEPRDDSIPKKWSGAFNTCVLSTVGSASDL